MKGSELAAARAQLGLTPEQLAAELGIPPHAYAACEAGGAELPRNLAEIVAYRAAAAERGAALAASGLPECEWIAQWDREAPDGGAKLATMQAYLERAREHTETCPVCQARDRFVAERFPEMPPPPMSTGMRAFDATMRWVEARPAWMRPALYGAAALALMTSVRAVFMLLGAFRQPRLALLAIGAIVAAAAAGAIGGLVYYFLGRPLRGIRGVGRYLAGIVAVAGYAGGIGAIMALSGEDILVGGVGESLAVAGALVVLFGLVVGHMWFREV